MTNTTQVLEVPELLESESSESVKTIVFALGVNVTIATAKAVVGLATGSVVMLAEAAHSVADSSTELILLGGSFHARKRPRALFFWSLVAAVDMFAVGGVYACWEGVRSIVSPEVSNGFAWIGLLVLAFSFSLESFSFRNAFRSLSAESKVNGVSFLNCVRTTKNTDVKTVLYEDAADMFGCVLAAVGLGLRLLTGSFVWEGVAAVLVGLLLVVMAYELGSQNVRLLLAPTAA